MFTMEGEAVQPQVWKLSSTEIPGYSELERTPKDHGVLALGDLTPDLGMINTMLQFFWLLKTIPSKTHLDVK